MDEKKLAKVILDAESKIFIIHIAVLKILLAGITIFFLCVIQVKLVPIITLK